MQDYRVEGYLLKLPLSAAVVVRHIEPAPKEENIAVVDASFLEKYKPRVE